MSNNGWIKLHRKMLDNPIICKDSDYVAVWVYLLLNATHTNYDVLFNKERITLKNGQLLTGRKSISEKLHISESKVQRILKTFENEQQIEQQTTPQNRLISICSWDTYQNSEQPFEQQVNNKRTTSEQQVNTNKKINKIKNEITITKASSKKPTVSEEEIESLWELYPKKKGKSQALKSITKLLQEYSIDDLKKCVFEYKREIQLQNTKEQFIQYGSTFFSKGYLDYVSKPKTEKQDTGDFFTEVVYDPSNK